MQFIGKRNGFLSTVAVLATVFGTAASGQALRNASPPAEAPPANYSGNQYVDSNGCVFVRAGIGGTVNWVPRVSRTRDQLCGFQPTSSASTASLPPLAPLPERPPETEATQVAAQPQPSEPTIVPAAPEPEPVVAAVQPQPVEPPTPVAPRVAQPEQAASPSNPLSNPLNGQPLATAAASPSPQVIVPEAAPQPRVLTRAQACAGLTGVQPNLISQRTGQPIDCGGTTPAVQQVASVAPPVVAPQPAVAAPVQRRLTRADACAAMAASGRQYVSTLTGRTLQCAPNTNLNGLARLQADLRLPQESYRNPLDSAPGSFATPERELTRASRTQIPYSNPLDSAPGSTFTPNVNTRVVQVPVAAGQTISHARTRSPLQALLGQEPAPYSNPTRSFALTAPTVPSGYDRVWGDGRLNTQRGLPVASTTRTVRYATQPLPQAQQQPNAVTTRAATQRPQAEQISGHRYVQVGTYGTRDQAQSIAQALRSRGLPMRVGVYNQQGREMRIVLAGPFANDGQLQSALNTTRGAGHSGAFTRR